MEFLELQKPMADKKDKIKEQKNKPIKDELNAFKLRKNFSADDVQNLINNMDSVISEYKAEQKGFDPATMVKTVRGGKTVWITKEEMNAALSKRRRIFAKEHAKDYAKQPQEGLQESSESYRRLTICQNLIDTIRMVSAEKSMPFVKYKRNLEAQMNQSSSQAKDYRMIEEALRRKKEEDPLYREMQNANEKMMQALEDNNLTDADICQTYYNKHLDEYESIQKRIDSYQKRAEESKETYLATKRKVYCIQYEMIRRGSKVFVDFIKELMYFDPEGHFSKNTVSLLKTLQANLKENDSLIRHLHKAPMEELKSNPAQFSSADNAVMQLFDDLLLFLESFNHAWNHCVLDDPKKSIKKMPAQKDAAQPTAARMAFSTKPESE